MLIKGTLILLIATAYFHTAPPAIAMSRHHEGEARIWIEDEKICLGPDTRYVFGGYFFPRHAEVDENEVRLYGISISRNDDTYVWETYSQGFELSGPRLMSDTCLPYGENIETFTTKVPAKEIEPGMYSIMLMARDQKGRRASFFTNKCITGSPGNWSISSVKINEQDLTSSRWSCE